MLRSMLGLSLSAKTKSAEKIKAISDAVFDLTASPLYKYRAKNNYLPVVGEGSLKAKIMFIGEATGKNEAKAGSPFCGAAGKVLDGLLASAGLNRADVYITNI